MIVPITRSDGQWIEWIIIELQGDLEFASTDPESGQFIGDLHYTQTGIPIMILGMYLIHGKETSLPKPMAVLEQKKTSSKVAYVMRGMIRKKLIFKGKPKRIITDVPASI